MSWMKKLRRIRSEIHETHRSVGDLADRAHEARLQDGLRAMDAKLQDALRSVEEKFQHLQQSVGSFDARLQQSIDASRKGAGEFVPPGHFYSPITDPADLEARRGSIFDRTRPPVGIDLRVQAQLDLLSRLAEHAARLPFQDEPANGLRYGYENEFFGRGDAMVLAAMLMELRPSRVVEVGSGHSSCVMMDVNEHFLDRRTRIDFVEPNPERLLRLIREEDRETYPVHRTVVQRCDPDIFTRLAAGDVLFIDSTHVSKTGSDVNFELFGILPQLAKGVYVHFHDIFYPFEYPESWAIADNRSWNEIYVLRAFLTDNASWEIVFFNDYVGREHPQAASALPDFERNPGGGLWLRKL